MFKTRRKFSAGFIIFYNAVAVLGHPVGSGNGISAATFADAIFSLVDKNIISKKYNNPLRCGGNTERSVLDSAYNTELIHMQFNI